MNILSDLIGKRVTVFMWIRAPGARDSCDGEMTKLVTGVIRAMTLTPDGFAVLVQNDQVFYGSRRVGGLAFFTIGPRGGVDMVPIQETPAMNRYRRLQEMLVGARQTKDASLETTYLADMQNLWPMLSQDEQDLLVSETS